MPEAAELLLCALKAADWGSVHLPGSQQVKGSDTECFSKEWIHHSHHLSFKLRNMGRIGGVGSPRVEIVFWNVSSRNYPIKVWYDHLMDYCADFETENFKTVKSPGKLYDQMLV